MVDIIALVNRVFMCQQRISENEEWPRSLRPVYRMGGQPDYLSLIVQRLRLPTIESGGSLQSTHPLEGEFLGDEMR